MSSEKDHQCESCAEWITEMEYDGHDGMCTDCFYEDEDDEIDTDDDWDTEDEEDPLDCWRDDDEPW